MPTKRPRNGSQTTRSDDAAQQLFWALASELQSQESSVGKGTIMNGRCLRVGEEFLALVDYKGSGLVVKLPRPRIAALSAVESIIHDAPTDWIRLPKFESRLAIQTPRKTG